VCMSDITVDDVFKAVERVLGNTLKDTRCLSGQF
jgi:hypothetical protein